jgi:hypothetical protein
MYTTEDGMKIVFFLFFIMTTFPVCPTALERKPLMDNRNSFDEVKLNSKEPGPSSPKVDDDFRGIKIVAPARVVLGEGAPFVVCGTVRFNYRFTLRFASFSNDITLVVVNTATKKSYSHNLLRPGFKPGPKHFIKEEDVDPGDVVTEWFNADLFYYIDNLPREEGTYWVYATIGDVKSNILTVELVESKK